VQPKEFNEVMAHLPLHHDKLAACKTPGDRYCATFWLATLAFAEDADMEMLQILAMFCKCPDLLQARPPSISTFNLAEGKACDEKQLVKTVRRYVLPEEVCPEFTLVRRENELLKNYNSRRESAWKAAHNAEVWKAVAALAYQWPCPNPTTPPFLDVSKHINGAPLMRAVQVRFQIWYNNRLLQDYLDSTVFSLLSFTRNSVRPSPLEYAHAPQCLSPVGYFSMRNIFAASALKNVKVYPCPSLPTLVISQSKSSETAQPRLRHLLQTLGQTIGRSNYERSYLSDLESSLDALLGQDQQHSVKKGLTSKLFEEYHSECEAYATKMYEQILESINRHPDSSGEQTLQHWPRMSPSLLLQHLAHDQRNALPGAWKDRIVNYGLALTALQRAGRLMQLHSALEKGGRKAQAVTSDKGSQAIDLVNELRNPGHLNWNPSEYPEYLLMEVESSILIRDVQQQIATEMRAPSIDGNAVMQLNMGEGKSTVITPMVAAALADGTQLVRVVVAKPQSKQMAQMLISKFGGLLRRQIYYMPFSRSLQLDKAAAETMLEVLRQCRRFGGILLVQPEHILSFRLMAPECCIADKDAVGRTLMATQDFFDEYSRDIVDESDENFSVRFELIYTMGAQQPIELSPDRWFLLQLLDHVQKSAIHVAEVLPFSIELHSGDDGTFPRMRLLRGDATKLLVLQVAAEIRDNGLGGFQMSRQSEKMRKAVYDYITVLDLDDEIVQFVENGEFWGSSKTSILFLRGILAGGVLAFVLGQKR
jgi:hypothetical protein